MSNELISLYNDFFNINSKICNLIETEYVGSVITYASKKWVVDRTDADIIKDCESISLFLLPEEYSDENKYEDLFNNGLIDSVGLWVSIFDIKKEF